MNNWYKENIEEGIREEVKLLRNNGFNTECSCEHGNYIQCSYVPDGEIERLHKLLFDNGYRYYSISVTATVMDGHVYPSMEIRFGD